MTEVEKAGDNSSMVSSLYHFPPLYEGDCFYDILARFSEESGYLKSNDVSKELFGTHPDLRSAVVLPYKAELIYTWLGKDSNITMENLRDNHSAWQYLQTNGEIAEMGFAPMDRDDVRPGRKKLARMASLFQKGVCYLRYCPHCAVVDRLTVGKPFWHQVHQLYGVKLCPVHGIPLLESGVFLGRRLNVYVPASKVLDDMGIQEGLRLSAALAEKAVPFKTQYLSLAKTIDRLLKCGLKLGGQGQLFRRYALASHRISFPPTGEDFLEAILSLGGRAFLEDLYPNGTCEEEIEAFRKKAQKSFTPLEHALIITALGSSFWMG